MTSVWMAIDPGLNGGLVIMAAAHGETPRVLAAEPLPVAGKNVGLSLLLDYRDLFSYDNLVVEEQAGRPTDGVRSLNTTLPNYGMLLGMAFTAKIPLTVVGPKMWKDVVLRGTARDKAAAIAFTQQRYPSVDLLPGRKRTAHDGIADAVCIGHWFWQTQLTRP